MEENSESEKKERENNEIKQANIINSQISEASDPKKKKKKNKKKKDKNQNEKEEEKTAENNNEPTQDPKAQFEKELEWCINQIRMGMQINKLDQQQQKESRQVLSILESETAPLIKKRHLMSVIFGDYRKMMKKP